MRDSRRVAWAKPTLVMHIRAMAESCFASLEYELLKRTVLNEDKVRGANGIVQLHRRLVQPPATAWLNRDDDTERV